MWRLAVGLTALLTHTVCRRCSMVPLWTLVHWMPRCRHSPAFPRNSAPGNHQTGDRNTYSYIRICWVILHFVFCAFFPPRNLWYFFCTACFHLHLYPLTVTPPRNRMALHTRLHESGSTFSFVSVADGRVSRLHCIVGLVHNPAAGEEQALLQDVSTNGMRGLQGRQHWMHMCWLHCHQCCHHRGKRAHVDRAPR